MARKMIISTLKLRAHCLLSSPDKAQEQASGRDLEDS